MQQFCPSAPLLARLGCAARTTTVALAASAALALGGCAGLPWGKADNLRGGYGAGDKVTVILPGKGPVADVADAVREGVRAAHGVDDTPTRPTLGFVDGDQPEKVPAILDAAVAEGTTQAIGPLQKPAVDALAGGPALKVPTLALNQSTLGGRPAENLYQFALAPETEAIEVANKAHGLGYRRALMLYPAGDAGKRRADAFRNQWQRLGGSVVAEHDFPPEARDDDRTVAALLEGQADFLFLSADAAQAQRLYPQVRGRASDLPVIATSDVYPGTADPARDRALTGLYFVDLPWVLGVGADRDPLARSKLRSGAHYLSTPLGLRLYAMGIDAYRLAPRLATLGRDRSATFPGETGTLSIDSLGRVQRQLALGQFTATGPVPATGTGTRRAGGGSGGWFGRPRPATAQPQPARAAGPRPEPVKPEPRRPAPQSAG